MRGRKLAKNAINGKELKIEEKYKKRIEQAEKLLTSSVSPPVGGSSFKYISDDAEKEFLRIMAKIRDDYYKEMEKAVEDEKRAIQRTAGIRAFFAPLKTRHYLIKEGIKDRLERLSLRMHRLKAGRKGAEGSFQNTP